MYTTVMKLPFFEVPDGPSLDYLVNEVLELLLDVNGNPIYPGTQELVESGRAICDEWAAAWVNDSEVSKECQARTFNWLFVLAPDALSPYLDDGAKMGAYMHDGSQFYGHFLLPSITSIQDGSQE